ncbi:PTS sugar transporter subunit IIC [Mediterraneibacter gnavus]|uniref:PTS sugar transporter subunit IIC n=1 Tax=Mediterraneibacter gnavus TaxID=33038 RepID=UPI0021E58B23|nr:PTS sugar transporter subunit IIC [Mediterraneibacter gnavus]
MVKSLPRGIICAVAFYLGTPVMNRVLEAIPAFVQNGLVAAAGFIPALGIALLAQMILSKKTMVYFILGFALAAYLKIPMLGIAMMAGCLAVILVQMQGTQKVAVQEVEDDDF